MKSVYIADIDNESRSVVVESKSNGTYSVTIEGGETMEIDALQVGRQEYHVLHQGRGHSFLVEGSTPEIVVYRNSEPISVRLLDERQAARLAASGGAPGRSVDGTIAITAPMPGQVVKRLVQEGDQVTAGQGVIVVEAMKMENELKSTVDGQVKAIKVEEGANVEAGECLVVIE